MEHYRQVIEVFTPEQLAAFMSLLNSELNQISDWGQALITDEGRVVKEIRDTDIKQINQSFLSFEILHNKLNQAVQIYGETLQKVYKEAALAGPVICSPGTSSRHQALDILRYTPGQYYTWHVDQCLDNSPDDASHHRTISVVLYLSDQFEGGGTEFPDCVFKPKAGEALFFPSSWCYPHRAQQVTQGEKIVCVTWYEVYED